MKENLILLMLCINTTMWAQPCQNNIQFPGINIQAPVDYETIEISTQSFAGDYAVGVNFVEGETYVFSSSAVGDVITLRSEDQSTVLAFGVAPLEYSMEEDLNLNIHFNIADCEPQLLHRITEITHQLVVEVTGVGINTNNPEATLDINGRLRIADDLSNPIVGMMRFNDLTQDFEGYDGEKWRSFTKPSAVWGNTFAPIATATSKIITADGEPGDRFGSAMDADGSFIAISAPNTDDGDSINVGGIYLYERVGNILELQEKLLVPNGESYSQMGNNDIMMDGDQLIVSMSGEQSNGSNGGASIFSIKNGFWSLEASLDNGTDNFNFRFGYSVAIEEDYAAVSNFDQINGIDEIFIYKKDGPNWNLHQKLINPISTGTYGFDLEFSEGQLILSDIYSANMNTPGGRVEVWERDNLDVFQNVQNIENAASVPQIGEEFGWQVKVDDDLMIISAPKHNEFGLVHVGVVYIYRKVNGIWEIEQTITEYLPEDGARFGIDIEIEGDKCVVHKSGSTNSRKVYVYENTTSWNLESVLVGDSINNHPAYSQLYGSGLAILENMILVCARSSTIDGSNNQGQVYIYCK